ncbi:mCG145244, partial [Mus musculus]
PGLKKESEEGESPRKGGDSWNFCLHWSTTHVSYAIISKFHIYCSCLQCVCPGRMLLG